MKHGFIPQEFKIWIEARQRYHLSDKQIQMARELGLNPKKFGSLANHKQEPWKQPFPDYIEYLYDKHFKREEPESIRSIEALVAHRQAKKKEQKERKAERIAMGENPPVPPVERGKATGIGERDVAPVGESELKDHELPAAASDPVGPDDWPF